MNEFEKAMIDAKPLLPPSRWMAGQVGFRAGWIAGLKAARERRYVCPSCGDAVDGNLLDELIDDANAHADGSAVADTVRRDVGTEKEKGE